jgi:hypothetical protein
MAYKITGTVLAIGQLQQLPSKAGNMYMKRDMVITVRMFDQYTGQPRDDAGNTPKFTFIGERCRELDQFRVGDVVTVGFDIYGRSYDKDGRREYMTDVRPIHVARVMGAQSVAAAQTAVATPSAAQTDGMAFASSPFPSSGTIGSTAAIQPQNKATDELPF